MKSFLEHFEEKRLESLRRQIKPLYKESNMKPKVELIEVADESTYTKPDYTVLIGMIVMVMLCGIIYTAVNVYSVTI